MDAAFVQAATDWVVAHAGQERYVITHAPTAFVACVTVAAVLIWFVRGWWYKHEISSRDGVIRIHEERHILETERLAQFIGKAERARPEELPQQVAQLRDQLSDPSNLEDLRKQIDQLKSESDLLRKRSWNFVSRSQADNFTAALRLIDSAQAPQRSKRVEIFYSPISDCSNMARRFHQCFSDARWGATLMDGPEAGNPEGIVVKGMPPPHHPHRKLIAEALRAELGDADGQFIREVDWTPSPNDLINSRQVIRISIGPKPLHE
jgi:hypothetical protein